VVEAAMGDRAVGNAVRGKTAQIMGLPDVPHAFTFIGDFGAAMATLGADERAFGRAWHVPICCTLTQRQFLHQLSDALGHAVNISALGRWTLSLVGLFSPAARETVEMLPHFTSPYLVDDTDFRRTFGVHATPLRTALATTVAFLRAAQATRPGPMPAVASRA